MSGVNQGWSFGEKIGENKMTEKRYFEMVFRYLFSIAQDSVLKNYSGNRP